MELLPSEELVFSSGNIYVLAYDESSSSWSYLTNETCDVNLVRSLAFVRIIAKETLAKKASLNSTLNKSTKFARDSEKFVQWRDSSSNLVYGLSFLDEKVANVFTENLKRTISQSHVINGEVNTFVKNVPLEQDHYYSPRFKDTTLNQKQLQKTAFEQSVQRHQDLMNTTVQPKSFCSMPAKNKVSKSFSSTKCEKFESINTTHNDCNENVEIRIKEKESNKIENRKTPLPLPQKIDSFSSKKQPPKVPPPQLKPNLQQFKSINSQQELIRKNSVTTMAKKLSRTQTIDSLQAASPPTPTPPPPPPPPTPSFAGSPSPNPVKRRESVDLLSSLNNVTLKKSSEENNDKIHTKTKSQNSNAGDLMSEMEKMVLIRKLKIDSLQEMKSETRSPVRPYKPVEKAKSMHKLQSKTKNLNDSFSAIEKNNALLKRTDSAKDPSPSGIMLNTTKSQTTNDVMKEIQDLRREFIDFKSEVIKQIISVKHDLIFEINRNRLT